MNERRTKPRTHYIHRINYTTQERIVGTFVLVALGILIWLLISSGKTKNLFEDDFIIYGKLLSAKAVNVDTAITISGIAVGHVSSVDITEENTIILTMTMLRKYNNLLRTDSVATLTSFDLAIIGKASIEITAGSPDKPLMAPGSTIEIKESLSMKNLLDKVTPALTALEDSIKKVNAILSAVDTEKLKQTLDNINQLSIDVARIGTQISTGKGLVGSAIYEEKFERDVKSSTERLEEATERIDKLISTVNDQLERTAPLIKEIDKTVKATQRVWPISSAIGEKEKTSTLTSPEPAND